MVVGTVVDAQSRAPLRGVDLVMDGQDLTALSGADGRFVLVGVPAGEHVLVAHRIGYRTLRTTVSVAAGETTSVRLALPPQPLDLDEIVVTGAAGSAPRREVGNAVARLEIGEATERRATLTDFLQGGVPGVEVTGGSAEAGQGKQIRIRGNSSMVLPNQPLVYIDGVRMMEGAFPSDVFDQSTIVPPAGPNITTSPLDLVSVGDVERIEVIRGPAATTLFGTGSSNGVIQVFTHRGGPGPPRWTVETSQGTGWVRPFGANGVEYLHVEHFLRDAWWGGGYEGGVRSRECVTDDPRWQGVNHAGEGACRWPGVQWYQTYRVGVDGGNRVLSYFASAEHQRDTYALPLDRLEKYAFRASLSAAPSPRFDVRAHAAYADFWTANTSSGNHAEGILLSTMRQHRNFLSSADPRDIAALLANRNDQWIDRLTSGVTGTFEQTPSLTHRLTLGYDVSQQDLTAVQHPGQPFPIDAATTTRTWDRRLRTADYLGSHVFGASAGLRSTLSFGAQVVSDDVGWTVRSGTGFLDGRPASPEEALSFQALEQTGGTTNKGFFLQNGLGWADRYFLTTGARIEWHTTDSRTFRRLDPRFGVAWVASEETFWPEFFGTARVRGAYGQSGTAPSPFTQAVVYRGADAPPPEGPDLAMLTPESTSEWEAGFDWTLLGERLSLGFTWYRQTTTDALVRVIESEGPLLQRQELQNVGKIRNRGIEFQMDAELLDGADWALDVALGVSTNHSKVLDLGDAQPFDDLKARLIVGYPVPVSVGRRVAEPDAVHGPWTPDRYVADDEGNITLPLGPQLPTHFLTPAFSLRVPGGVVLAARGEYRGGNVRFVNPVPVDRSVLSPLCMPWYANPVDPTNPVASVELRSDTPDLWRERCTPLGASDYWFDAAYFKLRSLSAAIPVGFVLPAAVQQATLTVTLANALTWHREVPWWDLEVLGNDGANGSGLDSSERVPAPTTLTFGLRVRF